MHRMRVDEAPSDGARNMTKLEEEKGRTQVECEREYRRMLLYPDDGPTPREVVEWHRQKIRSLRVHVSIAMASTVLLLLAVAYHVNQVCR